MPPPGHYDVLIALPSYNEEDSIANVTRQVDAGCVAYFPHKRCVLLNADCKSTDGTKKAFLAAETVCNKEYHTTERPAAGKGAALRMAFERALACGAEMIICIDTDLETITPEWVGAFARPLLDGYQLVTPRYVRHRLDGTITNMLVFPVVYSVLGHNIRQPIGGEFGLSRAAVEALFKRKWPEGTSGYGVDIFLTSTCMLDGLRIAETELPPKVHKPSLPKLQKMVGEVLAALLSQLQALPSLDHHAHAIVQNPAQYRWHDELDSKLPELKVDGGLLVESARRIFSSNQGLFAAAPNEVVQDLGLAVEAGCLAPATWARLVLWGIQESCGSDHELSKERMPICLELLRVGYLLRASQHIETVTSLSNGQAEDMVYAQAQAFVEGKASGGSAAVRRQSGGD